MDTTEFSEIVWDYYRHHAREMPWREQPTPYNVVVSEFMLQQTQVDRARPKFEAWVSQRPDFASLAAASPEDVLRLWKGLGYNRRALRLHEVAHRVQQEYGGKLPETVEELQTFAGIGPGTAGAIAAYALNQPVVFIETNIRRVFLHHFFADSDSVADKELLPIIAAALDREHPREWYWALMDYGTFLKSQVVNPNRRSKHYTKQAKFEGSHRQLRGLILEQVLQHGSFGVQDGVAGFDQASIARACSELALEGFLEAQEDRFTMRKV
ncbi:MAG: A/G-specific adenine glycosylase [Patescibacteria group bacterium]|nr:A/G-specific adenine glycosylase [Patescibacteria group bacterium]